MLNTIAVCYKIKQPVFIQHRIAEKFSFVVIAKLLRSCGNLSFYDFEITTSFCFRKTPRDDI